MSEEKFTIYLDNFRLLQTEADGGHRYITTTIDYNGDQRELKVFFAHKEDETRVDETIPVILKGELLDENHHQPLLLLNTEIVMEEPRQ
jgi:hypothetical protein